MLSMAVRVACLVLMLATSARAAEAPVVAGDMVLGRGDAPVTVIEYASMTCPHCAAFHREELPKLKAQFIDTGKARLVFREFPLDGFALRGAMLARCAGPPRFFAVVDLLFREQAVWTRPADIRQDPLSELRKLAQGIGIGAEPFEQCMADRMLEDAVIESRLEAERRFRIEATPGFVVQGRTLGEEDVLAAVAAAVRKAESGN